MKVEEEVATKKNKRRVQTASKKSEERTDVAEQSSPR